MRKRLVVIVCLTLLSLALAGCSKCGPFWENSAPHACHPDAPRG
jgi:predicted small lipoprotein YifL